MRTAAPASRSLSGPCSMREDLDMRTDRESLSASSGSLAPAARGSSDPARLERAATLTVLRAGHPLTGLGEPWAGAFDGSAARASEG